MSMIIPWITRIEIDVNNNHSLEPNNAARIMDFLNRSQEILKCLDPDGDGNQSLCRDHSRMLRSLIRDMDATS